MKAMKAVIVGAGSGGAAAVAELSLAGHEVALWNRSAETLAPFQSMGVAYKGVLGEGVFRPATITGDLSRAIAGADVAVVVLPTLSHGPVATLLAQARWGSTRPIVLNPGHTGGALAFRHAYAAIASPPPIAELSTLTYVARKSRPHEVNVTGRAKQVRCAGLPSGQAAVAAARELFPGVVEAENVLVCDLSNVNMVLHPPGAVLAAAWVEARAGDFTFYVDAMTPGVTRVMKGLDDERRAVAAAFDIELPSVIDEMRAIGTVAPDAPADDFAAAIAAGEANRRIKGPDTLRHRYFMEDFGYGLTPFLALAGIAGIPVPVAASLSRLGELACGVTPGEGRTAESMGLAGMTREVLLTSVKG
jgi:opine dehydrogenase